MSVRKRVWITRKGETKEAWIVDYSVNGSRHIETFERKKDADAYEAKVTVDVGRGIHIAPSKSVTVAQAGEDWIKTCEGDELERSTIASYRQELHYHIIPFLGDYKLSQLSVPMVRKFKDDLRAGKRSPAMVKRVIVSLGSLLADAIERGNVATNVVRSMRHAKRGKERKAERRQKGKLKVGVDIPTPDEIKRLIAHLSDKWRPILLTAIFTGLRASELRGLRWADVDLKHAKLHVRQRADRYNKIGPPKSEAGERTVPLPPMLVNMLRERKLASSQNKHDIVFATGTGEIEYLTNIVHRGLGPAQIAAKIVTKDGKPKYPGLHSLRHFYASWCINRETDGGLGLSPKMVQERMGHSSITMTMDVYGHLFPSGDDGTELAKAERFFLT